MVTKNNKQDGKDNQFNGQEPIKPEVLDINPSEYYTHPKLVEDFEDLETVVKNVEAFGSEMGARNYLLSGPPGTGKTLAVKVLAAKLDMPLYDIGGLIKGQSTAVEQVFAYLRSVAENNKKGVFVLIDEFDGLSSKENIVDPLQYQANSQILSQLDGLRNNKGLFIFGTTNYPNELGEAMRSRISEEIEFLPPDQKGRQEILKIHANGKGGHQFKVADDDLQKLSEATYGYVGRDLKQLLNRAFTHAKRKDRTNVIYEDLEYGLKKTKPSALRDMPFVEPKIKLDSIIGYQDHKEVLSNIIKRTTESVILAYGPKGTGKTYAVEALAGEFGYNLIMVKGSELETKWVGETKDNTEKIIKRAKQLSPCIVCFDEISSFVERKGMMSHKDSQTGYLQSVLSRPPEGVYIIATENKPEFLNGPFMDRFIHKIFFGMPSTEEQMALWNFYAPEADAAKLVEAKGDLSPRDINYAVKRVNNYGFPLSTEMLSHLIKQYPNYKDEYKTIVENIGDSIRDYKTLKEFNTTQK
ncbi:MAG: AAA family ATPase [Candidatus Nanoarchaeia archaeon]